MGCESLMCHISDVKIGLPRKAQGLSVAKGTCQGNMHTILSEVHTFTLHSPYSVDSLDPGCRAGPTPVSNAAVCGDGICDSSRGESVFTCPIDCPGTCGDNICNANFGEMLVIPCIRLVVGCINLIVDVIT